ncbi:hypothetical protein [Xanthobacter flavus]|uniref:hypothetical protein n=1 Tax=Xanthobacter flavus TaxID=281 RepID=UPI00286C2E82|nr:hypothetical protein [Xanthobacter flavus]
MHVVLTNVRDTAEHVFLLRAEERFGKFRFGDDWVAPIFIRRIARLSSPQTGNSRSASERFEAAQYLYDYARDVLFPRPVKEPSVLPSSGTFSFRLVPREEVEAKRKADLLDINVSDEQFAIAFRMSEEARAQWQRVNAIRTEISNLCQDGKLRSFARPKPGGDLVPLPPAFWNTERWYRWFEGYGTSLASPYDYEDADHYLFVSKTDLDQCISEKGLPKDVAQAKSTPSIKQSIQMNQKSPLQSAIDIALNNKPRGTPSRIVMLKALQKLGWRTLPIKTDKSILKDINQNTDGSIISASTYRRVIQELEEYNTRIRDPDQEGATDG